MIASAILLVYLSIAAVWDLTTRRVPNWLHLMVIPVLFFHHPVPTVAPLVTNIIVIAALFYRWQKGDFGGADVKAAMVVAAGSYDTLLMPIGMVFSLLVAYSRHGKVERTRFIPWMLIGTVGAAVGQLILGGTLP